MKIDGREIAGKIFEDLKKQVAKLKREHIIPHLAIILIGNDPASVSYVNQKEIKGESIGAKITVKKISDKITQSKLISAIEQLNNDNNIHGIIVQQPLPSNVNLKQITNSINPKKDVDGFHPKSKFQSPIAIAVLRILEEIFNSSRRSSFGHLRGGVAPAHLEGEFLAWFKSKKLTIIGKGETGGKPIIDMMRKMGIEPTVIDSKTPNAETITKTADIIISAVGKPNVLKPEMLKKGVILISIGLSKGKDGKLHGDYDEEKIKNIASFYTPTPGGVGPVNVAMLLKNLVTAVEN